MRSMIPLVRHICVMNLGHLAGAALVGSLTIVRVCALAQALASLHLLQSANGCWCSTKPCLDRCSTTPNDKHMQGRGVPSAQQAEEDAVINQVGRRAGPSQQTLGILFTRSSPEWLDVLRSYQLGARGSRSPLGTDSTKQRDAKPAVKVRRLALAVQVANCGHDDSLGRI